MGYTVLIVDDSKLARMSVIKALNALYPDWPRIEAANADQAMAEFAANKVDLMLLDFNMPGRDGLTLAAELRALSSTIPIGVISANNQLEIVARAKSVGAVFLSKPLMTDALAGFLTGAIVQIEAEQP